MICNGHCGRWLVITSAAGSFSLLVVDRRHLAERNCSWNRNWVPNYENDFGCGTLEVALIAIVIALLYWHYFLDLEIVKQRGMSWVV